MYKPPGYSASKRSIGELETTQAEYFHGYKKKWNILGVIYVMNMSTDWKASVEERVVD